MNQDDNKQHGIILIEALLASLIFGILLIALLNYYQYIILNFHQIWEKTAASRRVHQSLELHSAGLNRGSLLTPEPSDKDNQWKLRTHSVTKTPYCHEVTLILTVSENEYSSKRWVCSMERGNVSGLSF